MDIDVWLTQLRKGAAELAILSLLKKGEKYGLELLDTLRDRPAIGVADGSLYPLLARLEREGRVSTRWVPGAGAGPPRKYYRLSKEGLRALEAMRSSWSAFQAAVNDITED